jgi:hypothetical protein
VINPLQKYVDHIAQPYVQPTLTPKMAQYILKALDYLYIYSEQHDNPALVEQPLHTHVENDMVDVIAYAPEEEEDGETN